MPSAVACAEDCEWGMKCRKCEAIINAEMEGRGGSPFERYYFEGQHICKVKSTAKRVINALNKIDNQKNKSPKGGE